MDALECIRTRRSVRAYIDEPVDRQIIEQIVDCARMAATAINIQPWHFVAVTDKLVLQQIANFTDHGKFIAEAPCCIAVFCEKVKYYLEDGSAATQTLMLAAHALGLASCWVAGDKKPYCEDIGKLLNVPDNCTLVSLVPIGRSTTIPSPVKKDLRQVLHWEKF